MNTKHYIDKGYIKYLLLMVITSTLWSTGGVLIKYINLKPLAISGFRSILAALVIWLYLKKPRFTWTYAQTIGAAAYAAMCITFVAATKITSAANAVLLQYTAPVFVAIIGSYILKERAKLSDWIAIIITIFGMVLFFLNDIQSGSITGNIMAILSGFFFALFIVLSRSQKDGSPMETILLGNIIAAIICIPFTISSSMTLNNIVGVFFIGVLQFGIPYVLYGIAIKHIKAIDAVLIAVIEPVLNPVWVAAFIGELPGFLTMIGGIIVLLTVTVRSVVNTLQETKNRLRNNNSMKL